MRYRSTPGLSGATNAAVRHLEASRLAPGQVAAAVNVWTAHVRGLRRSWKPWEAEFTCSCCGAGWARDLLEDVVMMLSSGAASEVRSLVDALDAVLLRRSLHDPQTSPELPWWHRRC